jgi:predicted branched-subunit amino acid permease
MTAPELRPDGTPDLGKPVSSVQAFWRGARAGTHSVFSLIIIGSYIGFGALAHDLNFDLGWTVLSTLLIWAAPAQVIAVSTLGAGSTLIQGAIAVALSGIRLFPMVASMLPMMKTKKTRTLDLLVPAHFTAVAIWIESFRLLPRMPRENRAPFCNGFCLTLVCYGMASTAAGYLLAAKLPPLLAVAVLFITPLSFFCSTIGNAKALSDKLAFVLGLVLAPVLAALKVELSLVVAGVVAGTAGFAIARLKRVAQ